MKKHAFAFLVAVTLMFFSGATLYAQDNDGCSNWTLNGEYAFTISGQILNVDQTVTTRNGIAMTHFDGAGNLTQVDYTMSLTPGGQAPEGIGGIDTSPAFRTGEKGTYHVNSDCTGTAEIDFPSPPSGVKGAVIKLIFVLSNHGNAIHTVVTSLTPPGAPGPVPAVIHSDGWKLGSAPEVNN